MRSMQKSFENATQDSLSTDFHHETVLIIDDDLDLLLLNKTILEMENFEVFTAQSGSEALALLNNISFPHLIILDMKMGEMSGIEFLKKLEQERPDIVEAVPIVFMTGLDQIPECRASGFIRKPTGISNFIKAVRKFIDLGPSSMVKH